MELALLMDRHVNSLHVSLNIIVPVTEEIVLPKIGVKIAFARLPRRASIINQAFVPVTSY